MHHKQPDSIMALSLRNTTATSSCISSSAFFSIQRPVRVSVVSTIRSQPPMIADELRRQCDNFIELDELRDVVGRPTREPRPEYATEGVDDAAES